MFVHAPGTGLQGWLFSSPGLLLPPGSILFLWPVGWGWGRAYVLPDPGFATLPFSVGILPFSFSPDVSSVFSCLQVTFSGVVVFAVFSCFM